ncbi:HNH endonuclease [Vulgatibacter incomptus]|uniref:HNH endonuclease n=1 Tax=Vulgatibacter incomptus TaxID=1391653 RepID=UPI00147013A8|nr:HNH endonuclease [Vulgatibacter incomptus]
MEFQLSRDDVENFWSKVEIRGEDDCWNWRASTNEDGYGQFGIWRGKQQKNFRAHRLAWSLDSQCDIPSGLVVRHKCDNPPCRNPKHLVPGTHEENMRDMTDRKRNAFGVKNGSAKLSDDEARQVFELSWSGTATQWEIARRFGVSQFMVSTIKNGKNWMHLLPVEQTP